MTIGLQLDGFQALMTYAQGINDRPSSDKLSQTAA
jgi:hypothetical protein